MRSESAGVSAGAVSAVVSVVVASVPVPAAVLVLSDPEQGWLDNRLGSRSRN